MEVLLYLVQPLLWLLVLLLVMSLLIFFLPLIWHLFLLGVESFWKLEDKLLFPFVSLFGVFLV